MTAPNVQLYDGPVVVFQGQAVHDVRSAISLARRLLAHQGIALPSRLAEIDRACEAAIAGMSRPRHVSRHDDLDLASSELPEQIGSEDVAQVTGWTRRTVQRRAAELGGRPGPGRVLVFDRDVVITAARTMTKEG